MKLVLKSAILIGVVMISPSQVWGLAHTEADHQKMTCAFVKQSRLQKTTKCVAKIQYYGTIHEGGSTWHFKPIKGYGKHKVSAYYLSKLNEKGEAVVRDSGRVVAAVEEYQWNDKPALVKYRHRNTFTALTPDEVEVYKNTQTQSNLYTCLYHPKKPDVEFCFDHGFL